MTRIWSGSIKLIAGLSLMAIGFAACSATETAKKNDAKIGCKFDSESVCQKALTAPVATSSGFTTSNQSYIQDNSLVTTWVQVPIKAPGGSEIDVSCQLKYSTKKVIYAYAIPAGTVSDSDRQWLHNTGMCIGTEGTEAAPRVGVQE
ncbi:MAG: hypothetical protein ACYDC3_13255 [Candidatus Binataceae bacterium]